MKGLTLHINYGTPATKAGPRPEVRFILEQLLRDIQQVGLPDAEKGTGVSPVLMDSRGDVVGKVRDDNVSDRISFLVIQQGGTSSEWYACVHDSREAAKEAIRGHVRASYNALGPFVLPIRLPGRLLQPLCEVISRVCAAVATNLK